MHDTTINDWLDRLELQDPGSRGHAERVAIYALALGQKLGLSSDELQQLRWGMLLLYMLVCLGITAWQLKRRDQQV